MELQSSKSKSVLPLMARSYIKVTSRFRLLAVFSLASTLFCSGYAIADEEVVWNPDILPGSSSSGGGGDAPCPQEGCVQKVVTTGDKPPPPITAVVGLPDPNLSLVGNLEGGGGGGSQAHSPNSKGPDTKGKETPTTPTQPKCGTNPESGHPVIIQTGEKHSTERDFRSEGMYGLSLTRQYRSSLPGGRLFGPGWLSDYDVKLSATGCYHDPENPTVCFPTVVNITFENGAVFEYDLNKLDENYYSSGAERMGTLDWNNSSSTARWVLSSASGTFVFDANGNPTQTTLPNGALHALYSYTNGQLTSVSNNAGQLVSISWLSGHVNTITDPAGKVWTYGFNANGMLASVTSPNGHFRSYGYDTTNTKLLTSITVDGVQTLAVTYDTTTGKVKKSGTPDNEYFESFVYGTGTTAVTNQAGDVQTFTFGPYGATAISHGATVSCAAAAASTSYDTNGYVDFTLDYNGNKTDYTYSSTGLLMDVTVAAGTPLAQKTAYEWIGTYLAGMQRSKTHLFGTDGVEFMTGTFAYYASGPAGGRLQSEIWKDLKTGVSRETDYTYAFDGNNYLSQKTVTRQLPTGAASTVSHFDTHGNLTSVVDAAGNASSYSNFDGLGRAQSVAMASGATHALTFDPYGNVTGDIVTATEGSGAYSFAYDGDGHPVSFSSPDGNTGTMSYTPGGRLKSVSDANGKSLSYGYVPATSTYTTSSEHDAVTWSGSVPTVSVAGTFSSTAQLDSRGRPWTASGNNGQKATYSLDKQGNMLSVGDTISTTQWTPDALNRSGLQTNPDTGQLQYLYGTDGRFAGIRTPRGLTFSYKRNGLGDITESDNPDSGNIVYTPDSFGRVQTEARSNGTSITYGWDGLDRLTSRSSSGNTESYHYDEANGKGQLTSFSSVTGSRTYGFDTAGRITGQTDVIFGNSFGQSRTFNGAGQLVTQTYPSGLQLTYGYSTDGHLSSISSNVPSAPTLASQMVYQPAGGGLYAWHYGNGSNRNVFFDADGRVTTVQTPGIQNVSIAYYADNTVKSQTDVLRSTLTASYTYDPNKRLQSVTRTNDNQSFLWDVDSNRTSSTRAGAGTTYTYATDSNRLTSLNGVNVTYMTGGGDYYQVGTRSYSRDEFDRLSVAYLNGSSVGQYRYNVLDQRVYKSAATGVTYYVYDPEGRLIAESTNNSETDYVWLGSQLLALYRGGQMYYVSNDRLARPEVATNASNGIVWRAANAAFDRTVSTDAIGGLNISYPGQYFDSESGLYNNGRRYYESGTGRYIQSDPIGIVAGVNTYAYVNGNPLLRIDRRGLISSAAKEILIDLTFDVGAAIIVAACPECVLTALVIEAGGNLLGAGLAYYEGRHAIQKNEETKQTVDKQCH